MRIAAALLVATTLAVGPVSALAVVEPTATLTPPPRATLTPVVDPFCWAGKVSRCIVNQTACSSNADCPEEGRCVNTNAPCMAHYECPNSYCGRCVCYPRATPTPTPISVTSGCYGDCNGDGRVTVDELMMLINIALRNAPLDACPLSGECCPHCPPMGVLFVCRIVDYALTGCP